MFTCMHKSRHTHTVVCISECGMSERKWSATYRKLTEVQFEGVVVSVIIISSISTTLLPC